MRRFAPNPQPKQWYLILDVEGKEVARREEIGRACAVAAFLDSKDWANGPHKVAAFRSVAKVAA